MVATYMQHNHEFYTFPNPGTLISLSNMEKMNIRSEKTVQKVNIYENNGEMIREVIYIQSPSIPEWMPSAYKIIISETGAWIFDKEGNRLGFTRNSVSVGDEREQDVKLLEYHLQNFIPLAKAELARLSIPNVTINEVDPGIYKIISEDSETTWDTKNLVIHTIVEDQQGKLKSERSKFFANSNEGAIIPVKEMAKHYLMTREDQVPYFKIEMTEYSDYQFIKTGELRTSRTLKDNLLSPGLIRTIVHDKIIIGGVDRSKVDFHVRVSDVTGRILLERKYANPDSRITIDLGNIQPGLYVCSMRSDDLTITQKFIAQ